MGAGRAAATASGIGLLGAATAKLVMKVFLYYEVEHALIQETHS